MRKKAKIEVIDLVTPTKPIVCVNNKRKMKLYEQTEDCFILDFDPFHTLLFSNPLNIDADISLIAEKGQVACRDYPHSRDLCEKFPFKRTPHENYCEQCYCYVCDSVAPCKYWKTAGSAAHCHATACADSWKKMRKNKPKKGK